MGRYLMLDIGAGTLDLLCYDSDHDLHYKAVVRSPVRVVADMIRRTPGNLVVIGGEMGGGPVSQALIERAATAEVVMSAAAAATIHHDRQRVAAQGIRVVEEKQARALMDGPDHSPIWCGDLQIKRLQALVEGLGIEFRFDCVAICAQDHGVAPPGVSHLDFRHHLFTAALDQTPSPAALLYPAGSVPPQMNRLATIARDARRLPAERVYVMDSGMAAILGACQDVQAAGKRHRLVLDVATSHTVLAALEGDQLCGLVEYHTRDVTLEILEQLLRRLPGGELSHQQVLAEGGHGAYCRRAFGYDQVELILATGPRRGLLAASTLPICWGAPWGDNMMTGTVGLLEAVRRREGLPASPYL